MESLLPFQKLVKKMIRVIGCLLIFAGCAAFGFSAADKEQKKYRTTMLYKRVLCEISCMISSGMTISEIFFHLRESNDYKRLNLLSLSCNSDDFRKKIDSDISNCNELDKETQKILISFFEKLGLSDMESQKMYVKLACEELDNHLEDMKINLHNKTRLYKAMGVLAGAFTAVIII